MSVEHDRGNSAFQNADVVRLVTTRVIDLGEGKHQLSNILKLLKVKKSGISDIGGFSGGAIRVFWSPSSDPSFKNNQFMQAI
jgi:hypothetical protein